MPTRQRTGQVQLSIRVKPWMMAHLRRRAQQESSSLARSSVTAILCDMIAEDAKRNPTGADQAAA